MAMVATLANGAMMFMTVSKMKMTRISDAQPLTMRDAMAMPMRRPSPVFPMATPTIMPKMTDHQVQFSIGDSATSAGVIPMRTGTNAMPSPMT